MFGWTLNIVVCSREIKRFGRKHKENSRPRSKGRDSGAPCHVDPFKEVASTCMAGCSSVTCHVKVLFVFKSHIVDGSAVMSKVRWRYSNMASRTCKSKFGNTKKAR